MFPRKLPKYVSLSTAYTPATGDLMAGTYYHTGECFVVIELFEHKKYEAEFYSCKDSHGNTVNLPAVSAEPALICPWLTENASAV